MAHGGPLHRASPGAQNDIGTAMCTLALGGGCICVLVDHEMARSSPRTGLAPKRFPLQTRLQSGPPTRQRRNHRRHRYRTVVVVHAPIGCVPVPTPISPNVSTPKISWTITRFSVVQGGGNIAVCIEIKKIVYFFACEEKMETKTCLKNQMEKRGGCPEPRAFCCCCYCFLRYRENIIGGTECGGGNAEEVET